MKNVLCLTVVILLGFAAGPSYSRAIGEAQAKQCQGESSPKLCCNGFQDKCEKGCGSSGSAAQKSCKQGCQSEGNACRAKFKLIFKPPVKSNNSTKAQ
jgi:hypothetical protein